MKIEKAIYKSLMNFGLRLNETELSANATQ